MIWECGTMSLLKGGCVLNERSESVLASDDILFKQDSSAMLPGGSKFNSRNREKRYGLIERAFRAGDE